MANKLIRFPRTGKEWERVGEGGMYVIAYLERPHSQRDPCTIDSAINLMRPKAGAGTGSLWGSEEAYLYGRRLVEDAALLLEKQGQRMKAEPIRANVTFEELSVEMVFAAQMGATGRILKNRETGQLWQAQWSDLTPSGTLLLHQVHTCWMQPPQLITLLGER